MVSLVLAIVALLACPRAGAAAPGSRKIHLDLVASSEDTPSDLCIVSFKAVDKGIRIEGVLDPTRPASAGQPTSYPLDPKNWDAMRASSALPALPLPAPVAEPSCTGPLDVCAPGFVLQPRGALLHFVQCVTNDRPGSVGGRRIAVLLVDVHTPGSNVTTQPLIKDIHLDKTTVAFDMIQADADRRTSVVVASVIGGSYAEGAARVLQDDKMELPLVPRCQEHEIALPRAAGSGNAQVKLVIDEGAAGPASPPAATCVQPIGPDGHFKMRLPYLPSHARKSVQVEVGKRDEDRYARYEGHWFDFAPPSVLDLRHSAISFHWDRNCLYPKAAECPTASLLDAGIDHCKAIPVHGGGDEECAYVCDPRSDDRHPPEVAFDLPVRVRFRRPKRDDMWIEEVRYGNQVLSGFVAPEDRHVDVDLSAWGDLKKVLHRPAAGIDKIIVRGSRGDLHYIEVKEDRPPLQLDLPGIGCKDTIAVQVHGERNHDEVPVPVDDGRIVLAHPQRSEEVWRLAIFMGGSGIFTWFTSPDSAPQKIPTEPLLVLGAGFDVRPPGWPITLSPQYAFMFGPQSYYPLVDQANTSAEEPRRVPFGRHLPELAVFGMPRRELQVGASVGVLVSVPLLGTDEPRVGTGFAFVTSPLMLRSQFLDRWSADLAWRLIVGEEIYRFETDFRGSPRPSGVDNVRSSIDLRLRFSP